MASRLEPTARQIQVFAVYCHAGSRKEAARQLAISETAVAMEMNKLFSRLGVGDPFSAARTLGWLIIPDSQDKPKAEEGRRWTDQDRARS